MPPPPPPPSLSLWSHWRSAAMFLISFLGLFFFQMCAICCRLFRGAHCSVSGWYLRARESPSSRTMEKWPKAIYDHFHLFFFFSCFSTIHHPADPLVKSVFWHSIPGNACNTTRFKNGPTSEGNENFPKGGRGGEGRGGEGIEQTTMHGGKTTT